jgi:hypothetical protein
VDDPQLQDRRRRVPQIVKPDHWQLDVASVAASSK